ncbi:MAG: hypothetical protein ABIJ23_00735 [Candidatus Magasanikbacteria bacterium]
MNKPNTKILAFFYIISFFGIFLFPTNLLADSFGEHEYKDIKPELQTTLPGLEFSKAEFIEKTTPSGQQGTYLLIPYLGEYLMAFYRYAVVVASILTVVFIIIGGLQWTISGGSPEKIKSAQKKISGALMGLILAILSYTLLYTINPNLVNFGDLEILFVKGISIEEALMSKTPGDSGDWEARHPGERISFLPKYIATNLDIIKNLFLLKPETAYASEAFNTLLEIIKDFYETHPQDYNKLNPNLSNTNTSLSDEFIQDGSCLDWKTMNMYGNPARFAAINFGKYLEKQNIVSYAFYGRGAPCATEKNSESVEAICNDTSWGRFDCTSDMKKELTNKNLATPPWDLEYCLDCSGFTHTIFKCGAKKGVAAKTLILFSCNADEIRKYQPIPKSETIPGDIVGYKKNPDKGIDVGHVMVCLNNGCTQIIHVHGPQSYIEDNKYTALSEEDETYLKILLQEKLEKARAHLTEKFGKEYNKWRNIESLTKEEQDKIYTTRNEEGVSSYVKDGKILLPDAAIEEMQKRTGFFFEYRRIAVLDHKNISDIPLPKCDNILKYSLCSSGGLKKINACK